MKPTTENRPPARRKSPNPHEGTPLGSVIRGHESAHAAVEGQDVLKRLIDGASLEEVMHITGMGKFQILNKISTLRRVAPETHRQMVEGLRMFLAQLAVDDILHWRPRMRDEARELESQRLAAAAYKDAKETVVKVMGLQSQTVEIGAVNSRPALTADELALKSLDPDVREALDAVVLAVHNVNQQEAA